VCGRNESEALRLRQSWQLDAYSVLTMMVANIHSAKAMAERLRTAAVFAYYEATKSTVSLVRDTAARATRAQVLGKINADHVAAGQTNLEQPAGRQADEGNAGRGAQNTSQPGNPPAPPSSGPGG
jgi:hypothetical protein